LDGVMHASEKTRL